VTDTPGDASGSEQRNAADEAYESLRKDLPKGSAAETALAYSRLSKRIGYWPIVKGLKPFAAAGLIVFGGLKLVSGGNDQPAATGPEVSEQPLPGLEDDEVVDDAGQEGDAEVGGTGQASGNEAVDGSESPDPAAGCRDGDECDPEGDSGAGTTSEDTQAGGNAEAVDAARRSVDVIKKSYRKGSHIFTMTVVGDGEAVSSAATTTSYNVNFRANYDPDTFVHDFVADISWVRGGSVKAKVLDTDWQPFEASIDVVWLDSGTLQVTVSDMPFEVDVGQMGMFVQVVVEDESGTILADFSDDSFWKPS